MTFGGRKRAGLLFAGDLTVFFLSLWITLLIRYGVPPSSELFLSHLSFFATLFGLWVLVFYMAGLYSKRVVLAQYKLTGALVKTQLLNITLAALFFFLVPGIPIAPKTNLAIYLVVSLTLILLWRLALLPSLSLPSYRERAALIVVGPDAETLLQEVNSNKRYPFTFDVVVNPQMSENAAALQKRLQEEKISLLVIDTEDERLEPLLPTIYHLAFEEQKSRIADFYLVYEEVFDRVPLSLLQHGWFLKNLRYPPFGFYATCKRFIDIVGGLLMGIVTVVLTPLIFVAVRLEGSGPLFLQQERIGQHGARMRAYKFRTMTFDNNASRDWVSEEKQNKVTWVGAFLRRTSLDEFPQFLNVLRGELSLVGPRNDIAGLGLRLAKEIPYYMARYVVKPGLTGWAQINQQYEQGHISPQSIGETKMRLAYDFYYIKNRSFALDILIALRTFKRMLFRVSS